MNYFDDTYDLVCRPEKAPPRAQKKSLPAAFPQGEALFVSVHSTQFRCAFSLQPSDIRHLTPASRHSLVHFQVVAHH